MKLSVRAAAIAAAVCASAGSGAGIASATPLTPGQTEAVEQAVAQTQVPFTVPLDGAFRPLFGETTSTAAVSGSLPAAPVIPPSPDNGPGDQLLPDPLVPALNTTQATPGLTAQAPMSSVDSTDRKGVLGVGLPSVPLKAAGAALSLGHPLQYHGTITRSMEPEAPGLDLGRLDPSVSEPQLETAPDGFVDLDQGSNHRHLVQDAKDLLSTTAATVDYLRH